MNQLFKILILVGIVGSLSSCELFDDESTGPAALTDDEVVLGLKEALSIGLDNSVISASSVDGYLKNEFIKILLPDEVVSLQNTIQSDAILSAAYSAYINIENDGNDIFDELITTMNRGAESAADEALPIFGAAITSLSFTDALDILNGNETAATDYFYTETNTSLFTAFNPEIKSALDASGANQAYTTAANFLNYEYNVGITTISVASLINQELPSSIDEYATNKAIDGLFYLVGEEEKKIREDPFSWGSSIIERVFGPLL